MSTPARDAAAAEKRVDQFRRQIAGAAELMGERSPAATAEAAVDFARHAALAVAFDPGFVHLLRINFFYDSHDALPYWIEAKFLQSPLCRDAEGNGLYVMEPAVRGWLLDGLSLRRGAAKVRDVATLLWQYTERRASWADRIELRHAQQVTALNFLAPDRAAAWLDEAERGSGAQSLDKEWFVAMRGRLPEVPDESDFVGDPRAVCEALRGLGLADAREAHGKMLERDAAPIVVIHGEPNITRWMLYQFLADAPVEQLLELDISRDDRLPVWHVAQALGLSGHLAPEDVWRRTHRLSASIAVAISGLEALAPSALHDFWREIPVDFHCRIYALSSGGHPVLSPSRPGSVLIRTKRVARDALLSWLADAVREHSLPLHFKAGRDTEAIAATILATTDGGEPERVLESLCSLAGVQWPDVLAVAAEQARAPIAKPAPIDKLIAEYDALRADLPSGQERTTKMTAVVNGMRDLLLAGTSWPTEGWTRSASAGERLAAIVLLQLAPVEDYCAWLGKRVAEEKPFVAYQALLALATAAGSLPAESLWMVRSALDQSRDDLGEGKSGTSRAATLKRATEIIDQRQAELKQVAEAAHQGIQAALDNEDYDLAEHLLAQSLVHSQAAGDEESAATTCLQLANACWRQNKLAEAQDWYERSIKLTSQQGDAPGSFEAHIGLGRVLLATGEFPEARLNFENALEIARSLQAPAMEASAFENLGSLADKLADYDWAEDLERHALSIWEKLGDSESSGRVCMSLAGLAQSRGDPQQAEAFYLTVIQALQKRGDPVGEATASYQIALLARERNDLQKAQFWFDYVAHVALRDPPAPQLRGLLEAARAGMQEIDGALPSANTPSPSPKDPWIGAAQRYPVGARIVGRITDLRGEFAYVDVGHGLEGQVHVSDLARVGLDMPLGRFVKLGQELDFIVLEVDEQAHHLSLGRKQLTSNRWTLFDEDLRVGDEVKCLITAITESGLLVAVAPGVSTVVPVSDLSWSETGQEALSRYQVGQELVAIILEIDRHSRHIALGIKQVGDGPFLAYVAAHPVGSSVKGMVLEVTQARTRIQLADHVHADLPTEEIGDWLQAAWSTSAAEADRPPDTDQALSRSVVTDARDAFQVGDDINATIIEIRLEASEIVLSIKRLPDASR